MSLFGKLLYIGAAHAAMRYFFPTEYNEIIMVVSFNIILIYSKCQIYVTNKINNIDLDKYPALQYLSNIYNGEHNNEDVDVVLDGKCVYKTTSYLIRDNPPTYYDFMIYSVEIPTSKRFDKIIYYNIPTSFLYVSCTYSFISISIAFKFPTEDKIYKLELSNQKFNFYIVNNRINRIFIYYLLFNQYGILYDMPYTLDIIDHDVKCFVISEKDEIIFEEKEYHIIPFIPPTISLRNMALSSQLSPLEKEQDENLAESSDSDNDDDEYINIVQ
jgi:hypothetical protein